MITTNQLLPKLMKILSKLIKVDEHLSQCMNVGERLTKVNQSWWKCCQRLPALITLWSKLVRLWWRVFKRGQILLKSTHIRGYLKDTSSFFLYFNDFKQSIPHVILAIPLRQLWRKFVFAIAMKVWRKLSSNSRESQRMYLGGLASTLINVDQSGSTSMVLLDHNMHTADQRWSTLINVDACLVNVDQSWRQFPSTLTKMSNNVNHWVNNSQWQNALLGESSV